MPRRQAPHWFGIGLVPLALLAQAGCQSHEDADELQALLRDGELTQVMRGALSTGGGGATGGGDAGPIVGSGDGGIATDGGGAAGAGGSVMIPGTDGPVAFDGGIGTGTGGSIGLDGGRGGSGGGRGDGGVMPPRSLGPLGSWDFDGCNPARTELSDSSFNGHTAFRSIGVACADGVSGLAVKLSDKEDIVYVPDQPNFTFENGVTVAGWFKPTSIKGTRTLFRKRDQDTSSFAMVLNGGRYQFVVNLGDGRAASVNAPAKAGEWTHVAGTYDGSVVRIYIGGKEAATRTMAGTIERGDGPVLMGNDGSERRFDGVIDNTFFDNHAASADQVFALTCVRQPPTVAGTPAVSAPTPANTAANFDIAITNHNSAACTPDSYVFQTSVSFPGITVDPQFQFVTAASGQSVHLNMSVTGTDDADPGTFTIPFTVFGNSPSSMKNFAQGQVDFVLAAGGCRVSSARELMIKSVSVVDDPIRTRSDGPTDDPRTGAWTFKRLVEKMAPTPADAPAMVEAMLSTFGATQTVNTFTIAPRPGMKTLILDSWPRTADGALDLARAPLQLQAIVNRFDLRSLTNGDAGEGRFVFAFMGPGGVFPLQATMIFEYKLPAKTDADVLDWANAWHALGTLPFPSEQYNVALQAITDRFSGRDARPGHQNGSAINAVRTNEIDFGDNGIWQLREFGLSSTTGMLVPATIKLTPDLSFKGTDALASFVNANAASIIAETHDVPETFNGAAFLTGAVFNDLSAWTAPGIVDNEARHHFSLNTCNGCHAAGETGVGFLQISPRFPGSEAFLSGFLTGTTVFDPVSFQPRSFNDLARRSRDLKTIVCPNDVPPPPPPPPPPPGMGMGGASGVMPKPIARIPTLEEGISRVH